MAHSERELIDEMVALDQMLKAERAARMAAELKLARATGSGNARTHSPAMALVANLEAQRANARKGSELRAEEAAIRARLGLKELAFAEFPTQVLRTILLSATTHDDFITWVSVCARVCSAWRGVVMGSAAGATTRQCRRLGFERHQAEDRHPGLFGDWSSPAGDAQSVGSALHQVAEPGADSSRTFTHRRGDAARFSHRGPEASQQRAR